MNLSISNIAWNIDEDEEISKILNDYKINFIDIAPNKYFHEIITTNNQDILKVKNFWKRRNIQISCMQSLLFNTKNFNIFNYDEHSSGSILNHLEKIIKIANKLGAKNLIFGELINFISERIPIIKIIKKNKF